MALVWLSPTRADDLKWRPPKIRAAASLPSPRSDAPAEKQSNETPSPQPSTTVLRTNHQEESGGRQLDSTGGQAKEPRKLKSVLVRRSSNVRPILDAQIVSPNVAEAASFGPKNPADSDETRQPGNVLRTARNQSRVSAAPVDEAASFGDSPAGLDADPFEVSPTASAAGAASDGREPLPLRLVQGDTTERPMRSVLRTDPFEQAPAAMESATVKSESKFVSQPGDAGALQPTPDPQDDEQDRLMQDFDTNNENESFAPFPRDSSIETERERAADVCRRALETIKTKTINTLDLGIHVDGTVGDTLPFECSLETAAYQSRNWPELTFMWKASALCHKPLYFEDVHLERYGHSWGWHLQPFVSGAHFFTTLPILPYKMGLETPNECVYSLGYYRPGNCAPYLIEPLGTSPRAVVWEAGAVVGFSAIVP
jgi:hypothetical protein